MSPTNVSHAVDRAIARAVAGQPQYAPCVDESLGAALPAEMLASDQVVRRGIATGRQTYKLHEDRFGAHMWLFSLTWSVVAPSVVAMVLTEEIPDLDLSSGLVFQRDEGEGYWFGFRPGRRAESYAASGRHAGESFAPIIATLCRVAKVRPAPLWAVVADGMVQPAVGAGNEHFEQDRAIMVASEIHQGLQQVADVRLPPLRFEQVCDDQVVPVRPGDAEPDYLVVHRSSCCMVFHGDDAGYCAPCPHVPKKKRIAGIIAAASQY